MYIYKWKVQTKIYNLTHIGGGVRGGKKVEIALDE